MSAGLLFIITIAALAIAPGAWAQSKYKTLHKFTSGAGGADPYAGLTFDAAGNLYGTTVRGGLTNCDLGCGTVFELSPGSSGWTKTVLYRFRGRNGDGAYPFAGLTFDGAGNLYGTTVQGGAANGAGTVFMLTPNSSGGWTESVLYTFCSVTDCADGWFPFAGLIFDAAGSLYGTTAQGGANNRGTVFKLTPKAHGGWSERVLYSFCSLTKCDDGAQPYSGGLIFDAKGNLYGTTQGGGARNSGAVFKLTPKTYGSWKETVLHNFCALNHCEDGQLPYAGLIFDAAGNLYGTTVRGGPFGEGYGMVFELTPNAQGGWEEKVLHQFTGGTDGGFPFADLIFDAAGNLYGTTTYGGSLSQCGGHGCGIAFRLAPNSNGGWNKTVLHAFVDIQGIPVASLILDASGNLYGTAVGFNPTIFGSAFEIAP
jgi:uncharacterized repeat protein (TIGR03803 family)